MYFGRPSNYLSFFGSSFVNYPHHVYGINPVRVFSGKPCMSLIAIIVLGANVFAGLSLSVGFWVLIVGLTPVKLYFRRDFIEGINPLFLALAVWIRILLVIPVPGRQP
jgi:hypothetical protein